MLILTIRPGDRIACRNEATGELLEIVVQKKKGGGIQLGFEGPEAIRFRLHKGMGSGAEALEEVRLDNA